MIGHQPKQCIMIREILEHYHRFVLLDSPQMGNIMIPPPIQSIYGSGSPPPRMQSSPPERHYILRIRDPNLNLHLPLSLGGGQIQCMVYLPTCSTKINQTYRVNIPYMDGSDLGKKRPLVGLTSFSLIVGDYELSLNFCHFYCEGGQLKRLW